MSLPDQRLAELLNAAASARQQGRHDDELRILDGGLAQAPGHPMLLNARGMAALARRDFTDAARHFAAAADADPGQPALLMNLATAHRGAGDDGAEETVLQAALAIDRRHFLAQLRSAELYERIGRGAQAAIAWAAVVQLAGSDTAPGVADAAARGRAFLADHNHRIREQLETDLGAELAVPGAASRRFAACLDHMMAGRRIYRNECNGVFYPFLPADEYFDRDHFPWLEAIEAKTDAIRAEALALLAGGEPSIRPYVRMEPGSPETIWSGLDGNLDWSACFLWEYGVRNDAVCALCPETAAALAAIPQNHVPGKAPTAFFSILRPRAHIPAHTGVTNTRTILHLPLVVPPGQDGKACRFRVGGETRVWEEGRAFAFDDTIEHEAWNDSDEARIVLIFDVWNPHLTGEEQVMLQKLFAVSDAVGGA